MPVKAESTFRKYEHYSHFSEVGVLCSQKYFEGGITDE